ncbi:MAG: flagellar biosynthetic protein FliO [Ktedonobacterales bacterium]|nr:flagellar biosynthetic protein FliO [Ktedonobacterales bacterium]
MEAQQMASLPLRRAQAEAPRPHDWPGSTRWGGGRRSPGWRLTLPSLALALTLGVFASTAAPAQAATSRLLAPTQVSAPLATPPGFAPTPANHASPPKKHATPIPTGEAATPLHLSDPLANDGVATAAPWWQTMLDVTWKLGLVVGLIYLATRALTALKRKGFSPATLVAKGGKKSPQLFEQLDEIQLAPQHALHAVRAGERVYLIARTGSELRAIGELELGELSAESAEQTALPTGFANQLLRAWSHLTPPRESSTLPALRHDEFSDAEEQDDAAVVEAHWVKIKPEFAPARVSETPANIMDLPVRRGTARPSDAPPPAETLTPSQEREILWYAEEHGDSATAKKFGLTRQRVTAMRNRYERKRASGKASTAPKSIAETDMFPAVKVAQGAAPRPSRPQADVAELTRADHPRGSAAALAAARGTLARSAYTQGTASAAPAADVARSAEQPTADNEEPTVTVGQILAARFGIKIPPTTK